LLFFPLLQDELMGELDALMADDSVSVDVEAPQLDFPAVPGSVFVLPEAPRSAVRVQAGGEARAAGNAETEEERQIREIMNDMMR
jgi:hypothetical protein